MLPTNQCEDDACTAPLSNRALTSSSISSIIFSSLPFLVTFLIVSVVVLHKLFPLISGQQQHLSKSNDHYLPLDAPASLRQAHAEHGSKSFRRRISALAFSTTIALATVLAELILCEISNAVDPAARAVALKITIPTLLFLLIILIPFLEIQSLVKGAGWGFNRSRKGDIPKLPWILQIVGFAAWLTCFWWVGKDIPGTWIRNNPDSAVGKTLSDACLDRIGLIGITLMALLSGFASVSSPWQSFVARPRPVTDSDIARKQAGLDATNEMLAAKRSRLRALQRKMSDAPQEGFMTKVIGSIRGGGDAQEVKALKLEISGLETMALGLGTSLSMLQTQHAANQRAATPLGRLLIIPSYGFSLYCLYRILATTFTSLRRALSADARSRSAFSDTDPINRTLSLIAKHWDASLDQAAWSRQISFLLSGVILLASFTSVLQTVHLFTRFTPAVLHQARANAALIVAQVAATYVVSSALLLRSNLPSEVGRVITGALGSEVLDAQWVDDWFEGCFLVAVGVTVGGIWLGRKWGAADGREDWDDYGGDVEMGQKRS